MLIDALRTRLGDPHAPSFRLMGEDLQLVTLDALRDAITTQVAAVPSALRERLFAEESALATEAHAWLRKYNRSLHGRVAGYLELARRCEFRYPWPVVAILGIVQVMTGMDRARVYGLAGRIASRLGYAFIEQLGDASEDILRRTNRGIFADSVPTVLRALRAEQLRRAGEPALAEELIEGTAAVLWDAESAALCRAITDGFGLTDEAARFRALAAATLRHFDREQAIFTHHISARSKARKLPKAKSLPAPVIDGTKLVFKPFPLPRDFDLRDHDIRVAVFGRAFVSSITGSLADYQVARAWVVARFGRRAA
ncbi:MAG: hypothetical protein H0X17_00955 [Deltaproteobacteria bacterium]|nr:hypothetical protein [Deltaproteobacteria bacterium]